MKPLHNHYFHDTYSYIAQKSNLHNNYNLKVIFNVLIYSTLYYKNSNRLYLLESPISTSSGIIL